MANQVSIAKTVTVTTNDPSQSTLILNVKGFVKKADTDDKSKVPPIPQSPTQPLVPQH